jgi:hypothetical protein
MCKVLCNNQIVYRTYKNISTAGTVRAPPSKKNAPGNDLRVAVYTEVYIGAYTSGIMASATPKKEFTLPGITYIYTYHSRFIPDRVVEAIQIFF